MVELSQGLGFTGESLGERRVRADARRQDLQPNEPVELLLAGFINGPHAAFAVELEDFELRKEFGEALDRGRDERGVAGRRAFGFHSAREARLDETLRAQTHRRVRGYGLLAALAIASGIHTHVSIHA